MFELKLSVFQGPLDLLLNLIEREELDITTVSLAQVTDQYWAYLHPASGLDPEALAEFIAIGARLLYIKSRALLPELRPQPREEEKEDAGEALAQMLVEYKRFRQAAETFRDLEERGQRAYPRLVPPKGVLLPPGLKGVTLDGLLSIFQEALSRQAVEEPTEGAIPREPVTVDEKIETVMAAVERGRGRASFRALVEACTSRTEVIVVFLAVLELMKGSRIYAEQEESFGDIALVATPVPSP
jgi:segregation and condensation protein A